MKKGLDPWVREHRTSLRPKTEGRALWIFIRWMDGHEQTRMISHPRADPSLEHKPECVGHAVNDP